MKDPIVEEIRDIRQKIEAENNGNFKQLFLKISESQKKHSDKIVSRKPRFLSQKKIA
ncbi:MAG: hypothetical protein GY777_00475 [Candidatus Brocadiaceae bacterium]|nr:hypothetical protein [Candidatus Brocadiaceae bacterium]